MTLRTTIVLLLGALAIAVTLGCGDGESSEEEQRAEVATALDALAADLAQNRPVDTDAYTERLQRYLEANPSFFFGSAAALLDRSGAVIASPYVYRTSDGYASLDLAEPSYNIEAQEWFAAPLAENGSTWTEPYFDEGGGDIWMVTRSVPVSDSEGVFAIVTTDLAVEAPAR
ncbi:MAG: cache domain-containing protein [Chloroflexota bacterium]|nr:cache domain-containing protein [Chloroflexota bacterium]